MRPNPEQRPPARPAAAPVLRRRRKGPPRRGPSRGQRTVSSTLSLALHAALFLAMWGLPHTDVTKPAETATKPPIPIEVAFLPQPTVHAAKVAPPGPPRKPVAEPLPRAAEEPKRQPNRTQAAAPKPLPPKEAMHRTHEPINHVAQRNPLPEKPTLAQLLAARMSQEKQQEEQQAAALAAMAHRGAEHAPDPQAAGVVHGNPLTAGSGFSGSLASRGLLRAVQPEYPLVARQSGDEGRVLLRAYVDVTGSVVRVELVRSSGRGYFDRAAESALRQYRFEPLKDSDITQHGDVEMTFTLR